MFDKRHFPDTAQVDRAETFTSDAGEQTLEYSQENPALPCRIRAARPDELAVGEQGMLANRAAILLCEAGVDLRPAATGQMGDAVTVSGVRYRVRRVWDNGLFVRALIEESR